MKKSLFAPVLFFILFLPFQLLSQEVFTNEDAGVQLTVPGGWFYEKVENKITFYPKDKDFVVSIAIHEVSSIETIIDALIQDLSKSYSSIDLSDPKKNEINGLKGWEIHGTAKAEGVEMTIDYGIYSTPNDKIMELGAVATSDILKKYKNDFDIILKGIKPIE